MSDSRCCSFLHSLFGRSYEPKNLSTDYADSKGFVAIHRRYSTRHLRNLWKLVGFTSSTASDTFARLSARQRGAATSVFRVPGYPGSKPTTRLPNIRTRSMTGADRYVEQLQIQLRNTECHRTS